MPPGQPKIEGYRTGEQIQVGDQLTLACICRAGNPKARLRWTRNDHPINFFGSTSLEFNLRKSSSIGNNSRSASSAHASSTTYTDNHLHYDNHNYQFTSNYEESDQHQFNGDQSEEFAPETEVTQTLTVKVRAEDNGAVYACVANNEVIVPGSSLSVSSYSTSVKLNVQCKSHLFPYSFFKKTKV